MCTNQTYTGIPKKVTKNNNLNKPKKLGAIWYYFRVVYIVVIYSEMKQILFGQTAFKNQFSPLFKEQKWNTRNPDKSFYASCFGFEKSFLVSSLLP